MNSLRGGGGKTSLRTEFESILGKSSVILSEAKNLFALSFNYDKESLRPFNRTQDHVKGVTHIICHPELVSGSQSAASSPNLGEGQDEVKVRRFLLASWANAGSLTRQDARGYASLRMTGKKKIAFTLAEVLITLGIIGVVAAMTMPALVQHYKKQEASARLKKFYSTLAQTIQMSEIDNGPSEDWTKEAMAYDFDKGKPVSVENAKRALTYFNRYMGPYMKYVKIDENPIEQQDEDGNADRIKVYLSDGSSLYVNNGVCAHITFDTNGDILPNQSGLDRFGYLICPKNKKNEFFNKGNYGPYCMPKDKCINREDAKLVCKNDKMCSQLLMMDGWEFKEDYPWKL